VRALLDTNVLLFWYTGRLDRLTVDQQSVLTDGANDLFVSSLSAAEVRLKASIGKLRPPGDLFDHLEEDGFIELPLRVRDSTSLMTLPLVHRDPFDRLLVCQAIANDLTLVTADARLRDYPVRTL
jgi:PIN domain nuclease of toxin-antitoxin system